jgi:hypothetical protein
MAGKSAIGSPDNRAASLMFGVISAARGNKSRS